MLPLPLLAWVQLQQPSLAQLASWEQLLSRPLFPSQLRLPVLHQGKVSPSHSQVRFPGRLPTTVQQPITVPEVDSASRCHSEPVSVR